MAGEAMVPTVAASVARRIGNPERRQGLTGVTGESGVRFPASPLVKGARMMGRWWRDVDTLDLIIICVLALLLALVIRANEPTINLVIVR